MWSYSRRRRAGLIAGMFVSVVVVCSALALAIFRDYNAGPWQDIGSEAPEGLPEVAVPESGTAQPPAVETQLGPEAEPSEAALAEEQPVQPEPAAPAASSAEALEPAAPTPAPLEAPVP